MERYHNADTSEVDKPYLDFLHLHNSICLFLAMPFLDELTPFAFLLQAHYFQPYRLLYMPHIQYMHSSLHAFPNDGLGYIFLRYIDQKDKVYVHLILDDALFHDANGLLLLLNAQDLYV